MDNMNYIIKLIKKALESKDPRVIAILAAKIINQIAPRDIREFRIFLTELRDALDLTLEQLTVNEYGDCA